MRKPCPPGKLSSLLFCVFSLAVIVFFLSPLQKRIFNHTAPSPAMAKGESDNAAAHDPRLREVLALQDAFIRNAKSIKPAVVSINNLRELKPNTHTRFRHNSGGDGAGEWFHNVKKWLARFIDRQYVLENVGSGLILDSSGHVLTNYHVIENTEQVVVKLHDGRDYRARMVGFDAYTNLAVLKIFQWGSLPQVAFGKSASLSMGEWVMAVGNPYGLEGTVTVGVVSGKGALDPDLAWLDNLIQTDASINPGNSGGPLINLAGEVIGINSVNEDLAWVSYTIPIELALEVSAQLIDKGTVERGWLGIGIQPLTGDLAASFNLPKYRSGVLINAIETSAPAENGGLRRGDIIVEFNGNPVSGFSKLKHWVAGTHVGQEVSVTILRDGSEQTLHVKIGKMDPQIHAGKTASWSESALLL